MQDCLFCKIVKGEIATDFVYQTEDVVVFPDINPKAATHLLILPKQHIGSFLDIKSSHWNLLGKMIEVAQELIKQHNLTASSYRLVFNGGAAQHIPHLHWHLLGG